MKTQGINPELNIRVKVPTRLDLYDCVEVVETSQDVVVRGLEPALTPPTLG